MQKLDAPDVEEGENFKKEAVKYFSYLKAIYSSFNKFTMAATDEAKEAERSRLVKIVSEKEEATKALQVAQQKFAAANNFRIEKKWVGCSVIATASKTKQEAKELGVLAVLYLKKLYDRR